MPRLPMSTTGRLALGLTATSVGCVAYAAGYEVRSYRLRRIDVPVLAPGSRPLRVLHVSDLHLTPGQERKKAWLRRLGALKPDLVVNTGDNFAHRLAVPAVLDALGPLLERPGVFVPGSNDYYAPRAKNPARYLLPSHRVNPVHGAVLPWKELRDGLTEAGWLDLTNARGSLLVDGRTLAVAGVDDPHLGLDRYGDVAGPGPRPGATFRVPPRPPPRGQLWVPGSGALVTNCDLEPARAKGLSRHPACGGPGASWLHVSAGLGTSPYAPLRFACPPEATLLTLTAP